MVSGVLDVALTFGTFVVSSALFASGTFRMLTTIGRPRDFAARAVMSSVGGV